MWLAVPKSVSKFGQYHMAKRRRGSVLQGLRAIFDFKMSLAKYTHNIEIEKTPWRRETNFRYLKRCQKTLLALLPECFCHHANLLLLFPMLLAHKRPTLASSHHRVEVRSTKLKLLQIQNSFKPFYASRTYNIPEVFSHLESTFLRFFSTVGKPLL